MKSKAWLSLAVAALLSSSLYADCPHTLKMTNNYAAPIGRFILNPTSEDGNFSFALLAEAGLRNYRANGTAGVWLTPDSRFKITGEYLVQKLNWNFTSGKTNHWVQQSAIGADYEYLVDCDTLKAVDVKGYYSYAPSKNLSDKACFPGADVISRYLAGSDAYGGAVSGVFLLCENSRLDLDLDYDVVKYRRKYAEKRIIEGFGGGFIWTTRFLYNLDLQLQAQFRRPFNYFGAKVGAGELFKSGWGGSLFANWTQGKSHLGNVFTAGVELAYSFKLGCAPCTTDTDCAPCERPLWTPCDLGGWVSVPAVYMPEVLVIRDQCADITSTPIPDLIVTTEGIYVVDVSSYFSSNSTIVLSAPNLPVGTTFDPSTGIVTIDSFFIDFNTPTPITIIGNTACGSTAQTFFFTILADA